MELGSSEDLKFLHPLKQRAYEFLRENPLKSFVDFQVLTGDTSVTEQHFGEVQHAIKAKENLELPPVPNKGFGLFDLSGSSAKRSSIPRFRKEVDGRAPAKEFSEKRERNARVKRFIVGNPEGSYEELVRETGISEISKPYFHTMKSIMRSKGEIPTASSRRTRRMIELDEPQAEHATSGQIGRITGKRYNDELRREILDAVQQHNREFGRGGTSAAMKSYGVSFVTLSKWLKEAGIETPRRGGGRRKASESVSGMMQQRMRAERLDGGLDKRVLKKILSRLTRMQEEIKGVEEELQSLVGN